MAADSKFPNCGSPTGMRSRQSEILCEIYDISHRFPFGTFEME